MNIPRPAGLAALAIGASLLSQPVRAQSRAAQDAPDELVAPVGTVLTIQVRDFTSSDRNSSGDSFVGMLQQPLVVDGWVVARPGQTVVGQVVDANRAGRVKGTSDLTLELTEITLVDGQQSALRTQLLRNYGKESHGDDVGAIAGGTALGAIIGVAIGNGKGAVIGAAVGAGAAVAGVLSTRGRATEIYPESSLTFRLDAPLHISTARSPQAFAAVTPDDYDRTPVLRTPQRRAPEPDEYPYSRYPRFPRSGRVGTTGPVIVLPPIIITTGGHDRRRR